MTDDEGGELSAGVRPAILEEGRPQGKPAAARRHRVRAGPGSRCSCAADGGTVAGCSPFLRHVSAGCCRAGY